jgi:hypothetical protein
VHEAIVDQFVPAFCNAVDALVMGLPFAEGVKITPLPGMSIFIIVMAIFFIYLFFFWIRYFLFVNFRAE